MEWRFKRQFEVFISTNIQKYLVQRKWLQREWYYALWHNDTFASKGIQIFSFWCRLSCNRCNHRLHCYCHPLRVSSFNTALFLVQQYFLTNSYLVINPLKCPCHRWPVFILVSIFCLTDGSVLVSLKISHSPGFVYKTFWNKRCSWIQVTQNVEGFW